MPHPKTEYALEDLGLSWDEFRALSDADIADLDLSDREIDALGLDVAEDGESLKRDAEGLLVSWRDDDEDDDDDPEAVKAAGRTVRRNKRYRAGGTGMPREVSEAAARIAKKEARPGDHQILADWRDRLAGAREDRGTAGIAARAAKVRATLRRADHADNEALRGRLAGRPLPKGEELKATGKEYRKYERSTSTAAKDQPDWDDPSDLRAVRIMDGASVIARKHATGYREPAFVAVRYIGTERIVGMKTADDFRIHGREKFSILRGFGPDGNDLPRSQWPKDPLGIDDGPAAKARIDDDDDPTPSPEGADDDE